MNRRTIAALLAAATIASTAAPATAQRFFMREKLGPKIAVSYDGTWSYGGWTDSGSCTNSLKPQTRTATCSGNTCDPSTKAATTQNAPCATSCETPAGSRWTGRFINGNTSYRTHNKSIASYAEFQPACEAMYKQYGVGACFLSTSYTGGANSQPIFPGNALYYEQYAWTTFANRPDLVASNCGQ
jgi:hypothetical protein